MESYTFDYVTRGGIAIEITLPLNSCGQILSRQYLTDSEKRRLKAIKLQQEERSYYIASPEFVTLH